jgi:hypothetical protein
MHTAAELRLALWAAIPMLMPGIMEISMSMTIRRTGLPLAAGLAGATFLTALYLGIVALAESPAHALDLFWEDRLLVIPLILGFGTQVGLFVFLKLGLFVPGGAGAGAATAAGGGVSTAAMVACCLHHVTDAAAAVPLVGLTAAATFLTEWKVPFMLVGLATNVLGIVLMLRQIVKAGRHAQSCLAAGPAAPVPTEAAPACHGA